MDFQGNVSDVLMQLDGLRLEKGLSYQAVADGCGLSKSTVCRILNGQSEPTIQQLQAIAATVQYKPEGAVIIPQDATQEAHIAYLKELIQKQSQENDRRTRQLQAHYNMLHQQDRRTIVVLGAILGILVLFICGLFLYDFAHMDRGWIQECIIGGASWIA